MTNHQSQPATTGIGGTNSNQYLKVWMLVKALFLGLIVDFGGSPLTLLILLLGYQELMAPAGMTLGQTFGSLAVRQLFSFALILSVLSVTFAVLGGYIGSRVAKKAEMRLATAMLVIEVVWDCRTMVHHGLVAQTILLNLLSCCGILIGAKLGQQSNQRKAASAPMNARAQDMHINNEASNSRRFQRTAFVYAVPSFIAIVLLCVHHFGWAINQDSRRLLINFSILIAAGVVLMYRRKAQKRSGLTPDEFLLQEAGSPEKLRAKAKRTRVTGWVVIVLFSLPALALFGKAPLRTVLIVFVPLGLVGVTWAQFYFKRSTKLQRIADSAVLNLGETTQR